MKAPGSAAGDLSVCSMAIGYEFAAHLGLILLLPPISAFLLTFYEDFAQGTGHSLSPSFLPLTALRLQGYRAQQKLREKDYLPEQP